MEEQECQPEDEVIREGDSGDYLFVVESGKFDCFKNISGEETYLKSYQQGELFGELALMYNAPRAATIKCSEAGKLYKLDRRTFSLITKSAAFRKR